MSKLDKTLEKIKSQRKLFNVFGPSEFNPKDITYQTMITSGDFRLIQEQKIKSGIVRLYKLYDEIESMQTNFMKALDQNYFPFLVEKIDYINQESLDPDFHKYPKVKNFIAYTYNDVGRHIKYYEAAGKLATNIKALIDEETPGAKTIEE